MLYQPATHRHLWDSWTFYADGVHHVYYLYMDDPNSPGEGIGHASSPDGVFWKEEKSVVQKLPETEWLGSGCVWRAGDRFIMNFSEKRNGVQGIFFAESRDLYTWQRLEGMLRPDPRWYNDTPTGRWDCIFPLELSDGHFEGYLTAVPWTKRDRIDGIDYASFGRVTSMDGVQWSAAAPPKVDWSTVPASAMARYGEVAAIKEIEGELHLLVCSWGNLADRNGTYAFRGQAPEGPFYPSANAYRLIGSRRFLMSNFLRFCLGTTEHLMQHTTITRDGERWFPPLKVGALNSRGDLEVHYWSGNETLKGTELALQIHEATDIIPEGFTSETTLEMVPKMKTDSRSIRVFKRQLSESAVIEATLKIVPPPGGIGGAGFYLELSDDKVCLIVAQTHGQTKVFDTSVRELQTALHWAALGTDSVEQGASADVENHFRLLVRSSMLEFYVNDRLVHVYSMAGEWTGKLGLVAETAEVEWLRMEAWEMAVGATPARPMSTLPPWFAPS